MLFVVPKWALRSLYHSYIHSNFIYGLSVWGPLVAKSSLNRIRVLQKKALRTINHAKYNARTFGLCKKSEILMIDDLIELALAKISYKYTHRALPPPVENLFQANDYNHNYQTRFRNYPRVQRHTSTIFNKSFLRKAPSVWAKLGQDIKSKSKLSSFCTAFKKYTIHSYPAHH